MDSATAAWGVAPGYHEIGGRWVAADPGAVTAALTAMGADTDRPSPSPVLVAAPGRMPRLVGPVEVLTEDGAELRSPDGLPPGLPPGYHTVRHGGAERRLILSPAHCHLPPDLFGWGWALQLYAVRSGCSWGLGDLADLRETAGWAAGLGACTLFVNPLAAPPPLVPQEPSPYYPSSRRFRNPLYLRVEDVPGAVELGERLAPLAAAGRALNGERLIDRDRVFQLKIRALEQIFDSARPDPRFEGYRAAEGEGLRDYATYCALSEEHRAPWTDWPVALRHPRSAAVAEFRAARHRRVRFHAWLQWLLELQLAAAAGRIGLVHDLPIGVQAGGADVWAWQDVFASGISVGAPPDPFNAAGQDWAVPPFDPWRLRAAAYEPFVQTLRAAFRHGAGLRVDHVMGLFRLFWIPAGEGPASGVYVRYPHGDLLDVLALESHRAAAFVVGEDLGTVQQGVREELAARAMLSYRLLWFEERRPEEYPRESLAALTTHDLPTLAGIWQGVDPDRSVLERLRRHAGVREGQPFEEVVETAHRALARSPSRLLAATLEDALGVPDRPNTPGTTTERPNWSLALPLMLEDLRADPRPARLAGVLAR